METTNEFEKKSKYIYIDEDGEEFDTYSFIQDEWNDIDEYLGLYYNLDLSEEFFSKAPENGAFALFLSKC